MRKIFFFLLLGFVLLQATAAYAEDICEELANKPEVRAYFMQHKMSDMELPGEAGVFFKVGRSSGGACSGETIYLHKKEQQPKPIRLECSYNGCSFGDKVYLVSWKDNIFVFSEQGNSHGDSAIFETLPGWKKLSIQERGALKFLNTVSAVYTLSPDNKLTSVCEYWSKHPHTEKLLSDSTQCVGLTAFPSKNIFPLQEKNYSFSRVKIEPQPIGVRIDSYYINVTRIVTVDLNGDGTVEKIAPGEGNSGAGCGCDIETFTLLDSDNKPLVPEDVFFKQLTAFSQNVSCGEKLTIVEVDKNFYIEKRTRRGTREIFPLTGDNAFKPICAYVNMEPLVNKKPQQKKQ